MITLKILRPYYIKVNEEYIHLQLEHQFFSIYINGEEYQFAPMESKEIRVNRKTKKIDNTDATFAFQNQDEVVYMSMSKLIYHPQFLNQVYHIAKPFYYKDHTETETNVDDSEITLIIAELEQMNKKRLIDQALDNRDEELFYKLTQTL